MTDKSDQYPAVNSELSIVIRKNKCEVRNHDKILIDGNADLGRFILKCTGEKTLKEIVRELTDSEEHFIQGLKAIHDLIPALLQPNIVSFSEFPSRTRLKGQDISDLIVPYVISLELTNKCNLACNYCYQNSSMALNSFLQQPLRLLSFLRENGVRGVELTGGEPLLHPQFEEILKYVSTHFGLYGVITNGMLLNKRILQVMKKGTARCGIQICLDGPDERSAEATTGVKGSFSKIIKAIELTQKFGLRLRVGMVIDSREKIEMMEETLLLAKSLGATSFLANPAIDFGRGAQLNILHQENLKRFVEVHTDLQKRHKEFYTLEARHTSTIEDLPNCGAGWRNVTISWTGDIKICTTQPLPWLSMGSSYNLFSREVQNKMEALINMKQPSSDSCMGCEFMFYCFHCFARAFNVIKTERIQLEKCHWFQENKQPLEALGLGRIIYQSIEKEEATA